VHQPKQVAASISSSKTAQSLFKQSAVANRTELIFQVINNGEGVFLTAGGWLFQGIFVQTASVLVCN